MSATTVWIKVSMVDATRGVRWDEWRAETDFELDELGQLFRSLQGEHGRCVSKVYITTRTEEAVPVGWVFQKRREYEDTGKPYLAETWVEVLTAPQPGRPVRIDRRSEA